MRLIDAYLEILLTVTGYSFFVLFILFVAVNHRVFIRRIFPFTLILTLYIPERLSLPPNAPITHVENLLIVYGMGLTLDKIASVLEHGWSGTTHPRPGTK
jgi:uncharacterized membrane protein YoaK (UPF0700 family)